MKASLRAMLFALVLELLSRELEVISYRTAGLLALAAIVLTVVEFFLFPGSRARLSDAQRRLLARVALAVTGGSYDLHDHLFIDPTVAEGGPLTLRLKLTPSLHNFFASMHGGAIASAVDVATTVAIMAAGGFPGVSTSLGVTYLAGCNHDDEVRLVPTVLKLGANLAFTECKLYRVSDGALMARGSHVKFVAPGLAARLLLALHPALKSRALRWLLAPGGRRLLGLHVGEGVAQAAVEAALRAGDGTAAEAAAAAAAATAGHDRVDGGAHDARVEPTTGLGRDELGKTTYFRQFGEGAYPMQGWDAPMQGALGLSAGGPTAFEATSNEWRLRVGRAHLNAFGALHGGCTASLVDVLGSAAVAFGNAAECGVATALEVQYTSGARRGDEVEWEATILKRGKRLVTAEVRATVEARGRAGKRGARRLVAVGTVTKSMRG